MKDLSILSLEELLRSLMTHEHAMKQNGDEETKKKKTMALKSIVKEKDDEELSK